MTEWGKLYAFAAQELIRNGHIDHAINCLRHALRETTHPRAKSKLMLAIRECNRAARQSRA